MYTDFTIKVAYVPTRRTDDFPDPKFAVETEKKVRKQVKKITDEIGDVELYDVDWLNEEGLLSDARDAGKVIDYMKEKKVDCLFIPHVNFGCEEAVALVGKALNVPVLLWGPKDETFPERMTDSQCGMFATSAILSHFHVPFTYVENCRVTDDALKKGLDRFIRVASVVKAYQNIRVGHISMRPRNFLSVRYNENEIMEKFGMETVAIDTVVLRNTYEKYINDKDAIDKRLEEYKEVDYSRMDPDRLRRLIGVELALEDIAGTYHCTCLACQCFELFDPTYDLWPCQAYGNLTQKGLPVACETDVLGAITSTLLQAAARGSGSTFFSDLTVRNPENENSELLWHCGVFPTSLAKDGKGNMCQMCIGEYELKSGEITVARFAGMDGEYKLFADEVHTTTGPATDCTYVWVETDNWKKWEEKFMYGPYIHHVSGIYGNYAEVLHEACRYMDGIQADFVEK